MNIYLKALLEEAYDTALDHNHVTIAEKIAELFIMEHCNGKDEQANSEHKRAIDRITM
jgi:hypothetical protein